MLKRIKIGLIFGMVCGLSACQDIKKEQNHAIDHTQDEIQQKIELSTVTAPASAIAQESIETTTMMKATEQTIPQVVQDYVAELQSNCKAKDKIELKDAVQLTDVWGDVNPEYLIEAGDLRCYEYASDRGNSSARDLALFATLENGQTKQIFDHVMFDYRIEPTQSKAKIYLGVGGGFCGQNMDEISRSEAIYCERLLEWDEKSQQFILGKISVPTPTSSVQVSSNP